MHAVLSSSYVSLILITMSVLAKATNPTQITGFGLIGGTGDDENEANPGDIVTFVCNASGDPSPVVSIWRRDRSAGHFHSDRDTYFTLMSGESSGSNTFTKVAECADNNQYRCRTENTYLGGPYVTFQDLTIGVICPATSCSGTDEPESFQVRLGQASEIYLCVAVNRFDSYFYAVSEFLIEKETDSGWYHHSGSEVVLRNINNGLSYFTIDFLHVNVGDLGNFRVVFRPARNNNDSYIYFQLTELKSDYYSNSYSVSTSSGEATGNPNSGQDSNSDSYSFPSTAATFDIALGGLLILNLIITIGLCGYVCGKNGHNTAKVGQQPA